MRKFILGVIIALIVGLLIWSPWLSVEQAGDKVIIHFERSWEGVVDGCGFNCQDCGVAGVHRLFVGYRVNIEYACGMLPADEPQYHQFAGLYVSPIGTVHGLPEP